jgi:hypothetical protein
VVVLIFARSAMEDEAESPAMNTATFQTAFSPPAYYPNLIIS